MKSIGATSRFRIFISVSTIVFCGAAISLFLLESAMSASNTEKPRVEKQGRLTTFRFDIKVFSISAPIAVRAVVSRETRFRLTREIAENFPHIDTKQLETEGILWIPERRPPGKEHLPSSWAGLFVASDGGYGHIQNLMHAYRVYRIHKDEFEIDYVFSADQITRDTLVKHIHEIDKKIIEVLMNHEAFSK